MGLAAPEHTPARKPMPKRGCGTCRWLASLTPAQLASFDQIVALAEQPGRTWTLERVHRVIQDDGYDLSYAALNRHLLGYYRTCRDAG